MNGLKTSVERAGSVYIYMPECLSCPCVIKKQSTEIWAVYI